MTTVTKTDFKADALRLFRDIEETGEAVVVTNHGKPVIEVRRYRIDNRDPLEILKGSVVRFEANDKRTLESAA